MVSGAGAGDPPLRPIEHHQLQGDEHASRVLFQQFVVQLAQDLLGRVTLPGHAAQDRHGHRHEQRRGDAFARHVADGDEHASGAEPQHFEQIAADLLRRLEHRVHVQPGLLCLRGDIRGQETRLNLARDAEVPLRRGSHRVRVRLRLQQRPDARLDFEDLEWLREVVVAADLEAAGLVRHVLQRAEEHDGQLASRLRGPQPTADLVAIQIRHDDVEQNEIGRVPVDGRDSLLAAERDRQLVVTPERFDQDVDIGLDIVDDEHPAVGQFFQSSPLCASLGSRQTSTPSIPCRPCPAMFVQCLLRDCSGRRLTSTGRSATFNGELLGSFPIQASEINQGRRKHEGRENVVSRLMLQRGLGSTFGPFE